VGQEIDFSGVADDAEDGVLPGTSLGWSARLYHCPGGPNNCHAHPLQAFPSVGSGTLIAPEHDLPSHIELTLTATDARGLSASTKIRLEPTTVQVGIESQPAGVTLTAGLLTKPGPFSFSAIKGANIALSAPQIANVGGHAYEFEKWSDGEGRVHSLVATSSETYVATYVESPAEPEPEVPVSHDPSVTPKTPGESSPAPLGPPTPPANPAIGAHPAKRTGATSARFEFKSATAGAGYVCKLDGAKAAPCRSPRVYRKLKPGKHVFRVYAEAPGSGAELSAATVFRWRVL
jgi:hypothetical protein